MGKIEREKLEFMISHAKADINLCSVAYRIISSVEKEEQPDLLEFFIKGFHEIETDESVEIPVVINDEQKNYFTVKYQRMVDGHLEEFLNMRPVLSKKEFYAELNNYIMNNPSLREEGAREYAIYYCCIDRRLPYVPIDLESGLRMMNEEYRDCLEAIGEDEMDRIRYILNARLDQKTERASLLLKEINNYTDEKLQTVLLAMILSIYRVSIVSKWNSLLDMVGDD